MKQRPFVMPPVFLRCFFLHLLVQREMYDSRLSFCCSLWKMAKPLYHHRSKRSEKFAVFTVFSALLLSNFSWSLSLLRPGTRFRICIPWLNKCMCTHTHTQADECAQPKWFFVHVLSPGEFKPRKFLIRTCGTNSLPTLRVCVCTLTSQFAPFLHRIGMYSKSQHANSCFHFPLRKFH